MKSSKEEARVLTAEEVSIDASVAWQRLREHWLSNIIHDIRGPLFAAQGYVKMALEDSSPPEARTRYLGSVLENLGKVKDLAAELEALSGEKDPDLDVVCLEELVRQSADELRPGFPGKNIRLLEGALSGASCTVGNRERLTLAVRCLLTLVVDFTEVGGTVEVDVREEKEKLELLLSTSVASGAPPPKAVPAVTAVSRGLRLHGGMMSVHNEANIYQFTCELPLIRPSECRRVLRA